MPVATVLIRKEPMYRRQAIVDGLKRLGYEIFIPPDSRLAGQARRIVVPESRDDLLVTWNIKAGFDEADCVLHEKRGGTVIAVENAYYQKHDKTRYALSVHGHCGSGWFPHDPFEDRFTALELVHRHWCEDGRHILVCGQRGVGSRLMASPPGWHVNTAAKLGLKFGTTHPIRVRPHPGNFAPKVAPEKDLEDAWACVVWSSSIGIRALAAGVPVFTSAPHWICADAAYRVKHLERDFDGNTANRPYALVHASLNRMAHGQWSVDEIASGEPFARMRDHGWGVETWA